MAIDKTVMSKMLLEIKAKDAEVCQQIEDLQQMRLAFDSNINSIMFKHINTSELIGCEYVRMRSGWCDPQTGILQDNDTQSKGNMNLLKNLDPYTVDNGDYFNSLDILKSPLDDSCDLFEKDELYVAFFVEYDDPYGPFYFDENTKSNTVNREKEIYEIVVVKLP